MMFFVRNRRTVEIAINVLFWVAGFLLVLLYVRNIGHVKKSMGGFIYPVALGTILNILIFYFVAFALIPFFSKKRRWVLFIITLFSFLLLATLAETLADYYLFPNYYSTEKEPFVAMFILTFTINSFITALALGYGFIWVWLKGERQREELQMEKLAAELNYLKAQVNPHFLFNALNLAFASATKTGDDFTADIIEKIASLMRYMLYDSNVELISLEKELDYIRNYIGLQQLRISAEVPVTVNFTVTGNVDTVQMSPLLLIPFVENAFKHGLSFNHKSVISVDISCEKGILEASIKNTVHSKVNDTLSKTSGIGLANVRNRLHLIYPNKHKLSIAEQDGYYSVYLQLHV